MKTTLLAALTLCTAALHADNPGFTANLTNCSELVGLGSVPLNAVQSLVPSGFTIAPFGSGVAGLVIRAANCQFVLNGQPPRSVNVAQIGVSIASPDGTGEINNYSLFYATNDIRLAAELQNAGLDVDLDLLLAYEFTPSTGELYVSVAPLARQAYFHTGTASDPPPGGGPVTANWWARVRRGTLKMSTAIPVINYGAAASVLHTSKNSQLGHIIGGNTDAAFPFFNGRGGFSTARFTVTVR